jgi:hypothetical protein
MRRQFFRVLAVAGFVSLAALQGCATRVKATAIENPAPTEAFKAFGRIEVLPIRVAEGTTASPAGVAKIQENFTKDLSASLPEWNAKPDNGRKLIITPVIEQLEFTHGAKRVLLGPFAGSSGVLVRLKIVDDKGRVVASPEFFQRADAMAAGFVFGVHDNIMLTRVANLASSYVITNYTEAKGGPTGADDKALATK